MNWDYIAGFFDGEGCVSTFRNRCRTGLPSTVVCISQTGEEGFAVLTEIREFLLALGIKGYICTQTRRNIPNRRVIHNLQISARPSTTAFLKAVLDRVRVKRAKVEQTLAFFEANPSLRVSLLIARNIERGKYGSLNLNPDELRADLAAGMSRTKLAKKHSTTTYTIKKYLDPDYRKQYDEYRKRWRAKRAAKFALSA